MSQGNLQFSKPTSLGGGVPEPNAQLVLIFEKKLKKFWIIDSMIWTLIFLFKQHKLLEASELH